MRLILTILLIGLFNAEGQIVINASAPYRPFAAPVAANLLLDDYPNAAAAYSLRKLDKDYTGAAIRVRKDTTGQPEQDIGFTAGGDLDTAALKSFLNARDGLVVKLYDQSGNGRDAFQTTQVNQPRICSLGVIDRQGGKPTILFDGSSDKLSITTFAADTSYSVFYVNKRRTSGVRGPYLAFGGTGGGTLFAHWSDNVIYLQYWATIPPSVTNFVSISNTTSAFNLLEGYASPTTQRIYRNNTQLTPLNSSSFGAGTASWNAIGEYAGTNLSDGVLSEMILYHNSQLNNRSGIATNINSYYSIY